MSAYVAAPPPWTLKGTIYSFVFLVSPSIASDLHSLCFSPLEASSVFASGTPKGGLGMVQVIRYTESPVGPYDELLVVPGAFEYQSGDADKKGRLIKRRNVRVSRIYVNQEKTCWNGRNNWNIPKHLARFEFNPLLRSGVEIKVFPYDTSGDSIDSRPSVVPFFTAKYTPISYLPSFPVSTKIARYLGIDITAVQPPLPRGSGSQDELPGTDRWCKVLPVEYSRKTSLGWWDLRQDLGQPQEATETDALLSAPSRGQGEGKKSTSYENWWPGFGRWRLGIKMEDATVEFGEGEFWKS